MKCPECKGKGWVMVVSRLVNGEPDVDHDLCMKCDGKGFITEEE